jgi:hypothetical protein
MVPLLCLLAACGGGGSSGSGSSQTPPPVGQQPPPTSPDPTPDTTPDPDPSPAPGPDLTPDPDPAPDPDPNPGPDPTPEPDLAPTPEDAINASNSQVEMVQRAWGQQLVITWVDRFSDETGFAVEARATGGAWQTVETLAASPGTGGTYQWHRVLDVSKNYRVSVAKSGYTVPLETAAGQSEIPIELSNTPLIVSVFSDEPASGSALIGLSNGATGIDSVTYSVDGDVFATSPGSGVPNSTFSVGWNTAALPNGRYWLKARATKSSGVILEHQTRVLVDNPGLAASLNVSYAENSSTRVVLTATATADAGINSVQFLVNGTLVQTVTTADIDGRYRHTLATAGLPAGSVIFKAIVRDNDDATVEATRQRTIDNPPTLVVDQPIDSIVDPDLYVGGTFADDLPGATLTVTLGDTTILQTSAAGAFGASYSLAGRPFGEHTLTLRVVDANGVQAVQHWNIVTQPDVIPTLLTGNGIAFILAVDEGSALFEALDGLWLKRDSLGNVSGGGPPLGVSQLASIQMNVGDIVMRGTDLAGETHIYARPGNISAATGSTVHTSPVFRHPWVAWLADPGLGARFEIYNVETQARISVPRPAGTIDLGVAAFDFVNTQGAEQLLFWATTSGTGAATLSEIYRYELATGITHAVTSNSGLKNRFIETDNVRLAWRNHLGNGVFQVFSAPLANPTDITTHTSTASWFTLRDGQLVWTESNGDGTSMLKVHDGTSVTTISGNVSTTNLSVPPACASIGLITFVEHGTVQMWDALRGKRLLMNTVPPYGVIHDAAVGYFLSGTEGHRIYRFELP